MNFYNRRLGSLLSRCCTTALSTTIGFVPSLEYKSKINFSLLLTKFLQLLNLAIFTTLSLFNLLAVPALHLLSLFLARQLSPWKSQIAHLDMHHLVFGINFQIHSVSLTILVSIHLLIHISTHLCYHPHSRYPSLHSFTPGSKTTFSTNPSHRRFLLPTGLPHDNGTGPDLSRSSFCF